MRLGSWTAANQRNLPYHVAHTVPYGLSRKDAIAAITLHPAEMLGVDDRLGSLEKGKEATFVAVRGDLLDPRSSVKHLILSGQEVDLESRHTRLYRRYDNRPALRQK
jgi:imidazolonepropionase-like amidohydrolase